VPDMLRDLFGHEAWADAELLRAVQGCEPAAIDEDVRNRLRHAHETQQWFLAFVKGEAVARPGEATPELSFDEFAASMRRYQAGVREVLDTASAEWLDSVLTFPYGRHSQVTRREALLQVALHSQNHRGQNLRRLKELGAELRPLDYVVWVIKGRPDPQW